MAFFKDLFNINDSKQAHEAIHGQEPSHQSSWTHELISAMKAYEDHVRNTGEQVSHPMMKEMLAGLAAAEVDKLFETKGLDFLDREEAKRRAVQQAHQLTDEKYGSGSTFNAEGQYGEEHFHHRHHFHHHSEE
ncbi:unnamed protein product [Rotaria magnacalcarata]|uniref:Uncharacterized protein n=2 Tax=Rotaria magnacalcarata TaxID=392030 RepID=A0A817ASD3_9BILA|nr:unnamed protein product [Rotaria magnacalcarata]CAF2272261.1 unnamed protein product [Rotaria magnacalcarata]